MIGIVIGAALVVLVLTECAICVDVISAADVGAHFHLPFPVFYTVAITVIIITGPFTSFQRLECVKQQGSLRRRRYRRHR